MKYSLLSIRQCTVGERWQVFEDGRSGSGELVATFAEYEEARRAAAAAALELALGLACRARRGYRWAPRAVKRASE